MISKGEYELEDGTRGRIAIFSHNDEEVLDYEVENFAKDYIDYQELSNENVRVVIT